MSTCCDAWDSDPKRKRQPWFALLNRGVEERDPKMVLIALDRKFLNVHDDPRFAAVVKRVGLP